MSKPVFGDLKTGFRRSQNRFLVISKPVFGNLKTGFWQPQNRFLVMSKPVNGDLKTGFWQPQNRFLAISKPVFGDLKTGFGDVKTGFWRSQNRFSAILKPVFGNLKTGFWQSQNRFLAISKPVFGDVKTGFWRPQIVRRDMKERYYGRKWELYLDEVIHERHLTVFLDLMKRDSIYHRFNEPTITRRHHHGVSEIKKSYYYRVIISLPVLHRPFLSCLGVH